MKKRDPDKEKKDKKKSAEPDKKTKIPQEEEEENQFGGIPNRDLKKNLGCGG